ncbi:MAG: hypothetical protein MUC74_13500, partial [Ideonella sp.]|nr:hypothetical protein [Ideonella sp.]
MSLILDALRKSEAERELGRVPGLRAQTLRLDDPESVPVPRAGMPPWAWAAVGAAVAVLVLATAWVAGRAAAPSPPARVDAGPVTDAPAAAPAETVAAVAAVAPAPAPAAEAATAPKATPPGAPSAPPVTAPAGGAS